MACARILDMCFEYHLELCAATEGFVRQTSLSYFHFFQLITTMHLQANTADASPRAWVYCNLPCREIDCQRLIGIGPKNISVML